MSSFNLYVRTKNRRVQYPRRLNITSVEAAHEISMRLARIFIEGRSSWDDVALAACEDFTVETVDDAGRIVIAVPGRWIWAHLVHAEGSLSHDQLRLRADP